MSTAATPADDHTAGGTDDTARWLGGGGLALGVLALLVALASTRGRARRAP